MLIRSQDKRNLCNLNSVQWITADENGNISLSIIGIENYVSIGMYSTKEKAIKVLDMIQNAYQETMKYQNCEGQVTRIKDIPNKFFQMPLDWE